MKKPTAASPFSNLMHIGIIARDARKTVKRLEALGIGTFTQMRAKPSFDGKEMAAEPVGFLARIGEMEVEVFQPDPSQALFQAFLQSKGEGVHHLGFLVDDLDAAVVGLAKKGLKPLSRGKVNRAEWADFDSGLGDTILQLMKRG
jgi:methylmalonyl-CoA/ethylmalonyl-CoA epimerase